MCMSWLIAGKQITFGNGSVRECPNQTGLELNCLNFLKPEPNLETVKPFQTVKPLSRTNRGFVTGMTI